MKYELLELSESDIKVDSTGIRILCNGDQNSRTPINNTAKGLLNFIYKTDDSAKVTEEMRNLYRDVDKRIIKKDNRWN